MAAAGIAAVSCVEPTNVVVRAVPAKLTTEAETKFVPLTVSVKTCRTAGHGTGRHEMVVIVGRITATNRSRTASASGKGQQDSRAAAAARRSSGPDRNRSKGSFHCSSFFRKDHLVSLPSLPLRRVHQ